MKSQTSLTARNCRLQEWSQLITEFGEDGWYQLEDEIYRRYRFTSMKIEIEEHHVGVYKSKKDNHFKKAEHPAYLLRNSLVSPTLLSGIWNSIAETAKANHLKPYNYFEYLLTEIPKHMDDRDNHFCEDLLPWSDKLPAECRK